LRDLRGRGRIRGTVAILGAAFVTSIAYVDPGNFATNVAGGARYGYLLLWAVLAANLMATVVQYLSAKAGIVTGQNLPQLCRELLPRPAAWGLWAQAELMAMATDLAELVGAAIALNLLFGMPLFLAGIMAGAVAFGLLALHARGYRRFERAVTGLLGLILLGFLYETLQIGPDASEVAHGFVPRLQGSGSLLLAVGIIGATVMPHVIYLHSALTQDRIPVNDDEERRELVRLQRLDVVLAMGVAGVVNLSMLATMAALFASPGAPQSDKIAGAHAVLGDVLGPGAAFAFALALLASGVAASSVGTYAGQVVMQGFIRRSIPLILRRAVTMTPALVILALGVDPTRSLVISQVLLSFGIPFALVPLVILTSNRAVMGDFVNHRVTTVAAWGISAVIVSLNAYLLFGTFFAV
jgi:manganese transport protein